MKKQIRLKFPLFPPPLKFPVKFELEPFKDTFPNCCPSHKCMYDNFMKASSNDEKRRDAGLIISI